MAKILLSLAQELADYNRSGWQDCDNAINADDFLEYMRDHPAAPADQVVAAVWKRYEDDGLKDEWLTGATGYDPGDHPRLTATQAYTSWSSGWRACALVHVTKWHAEFQQALREELEDQPKPNPGPRATDPRADAGQIERLFASAHGVPVGAVSATFDGGRWYVTVSDRAAKRAHIGDTWGTIDTPMGLGFQVM